MDDTDEVQAARFDADATASMLGLSDKQRKWCIATLKGCNQTAAAREAGFSGTPEQLRSAGSRTARSQKVQKFLELAALEGGGVADVSMDSKERHRILSRLARGADKNASIRACEVLQRMDAEERAIEEQRAAEASPEDILAEIAGLSPLTAITLAKEHRDFGWQPTPEHYAAAAKEAREFLLAHGTANAA